MKVVINNNQTNNKPLQVEESFFTGKHNVKYDGTNLPNNGKNSFKLGNAKEASEVSVKGHQLWGTSVSLLGNNIQVFNKLAWYEIVLSVLIFAPCLMFSWVGAVVGLLLACLGFLTIRLFTDSLVYKIVIAVLFLAIGMLLSYLLAVHAFKLFLFFM